MSFWDEYFNSIKEVTGTVINKTGKLVDVSRLKLTSSEISREITRRYEALGRVVYDSAKAGTDISGLVSECVRSIDALYGRLDGVNSRVAELRDKKYCQSCGAVVSKGSLFCNKCGARVQTDEERKKSASRAAGDSAKKAGDAVDEVIEKAREAAEDLSQKAKKAAREAMDGAKEAVSDAMDAAQELISDAEDLTADDIAEDISEAAEKTEETIENAEEELEKKLNEE